MEPSSLASRGICATTMSCATRVSSSAGLLSAAADQSTSLGSFSPQWAAFRIQAPSLPTAGRDEPCRRRGYCVARTQAQNSRRQNQRGGTQRVRLNSSNGAAADSRVARKEASSGESSASRLYFNVTGFPFPLGPFLERKTLRYEIERGRIWTFEQEQALGFSSVTTNIRMTVIRLQSGGLWVHSPIAPTRECLELLKELDAPVEHIVLPTFAYEHKVFVGPFSRRFPRAKVWTAPSQWSWPVNLPLPLLGIFSSAELSDASAPPPWADEINFKVLATPEGTFPWLSAVPSPVVALLGLVLCVLAGIGPYVEVAFFHRASRSLLLTDAVVLVPPTPPPVVSPDALLAAAENGLAVQVLSASSGLPVPKVTVEDTPGFRNLGWQRMVLQILYFGPSNLLEPAQSFSQVAGKLIVSPVVKTLVFDKVPNQVLTWIDGICNDWSFVRIIPCHFAAPIRASPQDLRSLFQGLLSEAAGGADRPSSPEKSPSLVTRFLSALPLPSKAPVLFPEDDLRILRSLDNTLVTLGAVKRTGT